MSNFVSLLVIFIAIIIIAGCAPKSDNEIGDLIENVIGSEIPRNYEVTIKRHRNLLSVDGGAEYRVTYGKAEFDELLGLIDLTDWIESGEVFKVTTYPDETVSIIPKRREIRYFRFRNSVKSTSDPQ